MEDEHNYPRISALERRAVHTDETLTKLVGSIAAQKSTMDGLVRSVDIIATRQNQPAPTTNWTGLVTTVIAVIVVLGSAMLMKTEPMSERIRENADEVAANTAVIVGRAHEMGKMEAFTDQTNKQLNSVEAVRRQEIDKISDLKAQVAVDSQRLDDLQYQLRHLDEQVHDHSRRISSTEKLAAAGTVRQHDAGKYVEVMRETLTDHIVNHQEVRHP